MAQLNDDIRKIMVQSRAERQALFEPVSEISRRVQPRHLVEVTKQYAKHKITDVVGGVSEAIKENGGTAAAVALGAVAVFDAGRKSRGSRTKTKDAGQSEAQTPLVNDTRDGQAALIPHPNQPVTNLARAKALTASAGGLLLGYVIGRAFQPLAKEQELFGKAAGDLQDTASDFVSQHAHGAKLAAAQAFGFARYSAAFLTVMAAVSDYMSEPGDGGKPLA